jgi:glycerol-3-phosphate responsive antiterminator
LHRNAVEHLTEVLDAGLAQPNGEFIEALRAGAAVLSTDVEEVVPLDLR